MMKWLVLLLCFLVPTSAGAESLIKQIKSTITARAGLPGLEFGEKSKLISINSNSQVSFVFLCSAGKEGGVGDKAVEAVYDALVASTKGMASFVKRRLQKALIKGFVNAGDAYCGVLATRTGTFKKAKNLRSGSIWTTAWLDGKALKTETDSFWCSVLDAHYACFEVAETKDNKELDGVSGCFEVKIDDELISYSFGRGSSIPERVSATFSPQDSESNLSCKDRKLDAQLEQEFN